MTHKHAAGEGLFESMGKAVDESMPTAAALRAGKLTRAQFDAWYSKRTAEGADLIVNLRERTTRLLEPVASAVEQGRQSLGVAAARPRRRVRRRRRMVVPTKPPLRRA